MFLKPGTLNALMKKAYKSGLAVGRTEDDWLYIAGSYWEVSIKREFVAKKNIGRHYHSYRRASGSGNKIIVHKGRKSNRNGVAAESQ